MMDEKQWEVFHQTASADIRQWCVASSSNTQYIQAMLPLESQVHISEGSSTKLTTHNKASQACLGLRM